MDETTKALIEQLVGQNAQLLEKLSAQADIIDALYESVEEIALSIASLNASFGDGFAVN